jgi:hypothetical protein
LGGEVRGSWFKAIETPKGECEALVRFTFGDEVGYAIGTWWMQKWHLECPYNATVTHWQPIEGPVEPDGMCRLLDE